MGRVGATSDYKIIVEDNSEILPRCGGGVGRVGATSDYKIGFPAWVPPAKGVKPWKSGSRSRNGVSEAYMELLWSQRTAKVVLNMF